MRAVARRGGGDELLWSGTLAAGSRAWAAEVVAIGRRLIVGLDGVQVADIADAGLGSGTIGAFAAMGAGVEVGPPQLAHAVPAFEPWHVFRTTGPRASGRRFRVVAGIEPSGNAVPPGQETIWKNAAPAGFRPAFPPEGVDLRLLDPTGTVLHERRFLAPSAFAALGANLVRAADGTGFVLVPDAAGNLPRGEVRLVFTFRRDNTSTHPDQLVLRQDGNSTDEKVVLPIA